FSGQGNYYTALAERAPFRDVVMAAEIDYTATTNPGDPEFCAILAGVQSDATGSSNTFIEVGFSSEQTFYIVDLFEGDLNFVEEMAQGVDLRQPQHVLVIIQNGLVTVYLNGELLAEELEVIRRSGSYGVSLVGRSSAASCIGNNIWVYQAPAVTPGLCEATAASTVNKRSGPGTENTRAGQFEAGSIVEVVGQASDGAFIWWLLDDETWVREDVVSVIGDCANVPTVTP
ncbi:MAG: SH3 domain-containing protein, partial [Chloroflexota bacterium]